MGWVEACYGRTAARLRATHSLRTPDAIQMATALQAGASFFLTNDRRLRSIEGMTVLVVADLASGAPSAS